MDLVDLELFQLVAERGSLTAAAAALHLSQPSASARISKLEIALGVRLFDRTTSGSVLTPAGSTYLPYVRRARALLEEGRRAAGSASPELRIGLPASYSAAFSPAVVAAFGPRNRLDIGSAHGGDLRTMLLDGALDVALTDHPGSPRGLLAVPAGTARPVAVAAPGCSLADIDAWAVHAWGAFVDDVRRELIAHDVPVAAIRRVSPAPAAVALARSRTHAAVTLDICVAQDLADGTLALLPITFTDAVVPLQWLHRPDLPSTVRHELGALQVQLLRTDPAP